MTLSSRDKYIRENYHREAIKYAESGKYPDGRTLITCLCQDYQWPRGESKLNRRFILDEINRICKEYCKEPENKA